MSKLRVVFCGYREWAIEIFDNIKNNSRLEKPLLLKSKEEYDKWELEAHSELDFILFIGWSWIISPNILNKYLCLGIHPSNLPEFRGGSPIQNQIIHGIKRTKISLMTLHERIDEGDIWLKEDLSLEGENMRIIFKNIVDSCIRLLNIFFSEYPNIQVESQLLGEGSFYKRRKAEESRLTIRQMEKMSLEELYNFIRCLTDPYPNAYLEDEFGNRLVIKDVFFQRAR